ncbi:hypothetical protein QT970_25055, partial [Microcoleus sp. herbarium8]|uniref:hypothetical protein n=1 Tax=Microcoleus sp. herbarium8 TaxID=3055436 RepID=UPI002FD603DB
GYWLLVIGYLLLVICYWFFVNSQQLTVNSQQSTVIWSFGHLEKGRMQEEEAKIDTKQAFERSPS